MKPPSPWHRFWTRFSWGFREQRFLSSSSISFILLFVWFFLAFLFMHLFYQYGYWFLGNLRVNQGVFDQETIIIKSKFYLHVDLFPSFLEYNYFINQFNLSFGIKNHIFFFFVFVQKLYPTAWLSLMFEKIYYLHHSFLDKSLQWIVSLFCCISFHD